MISQNGAALIAQVYSVGIILIALGTGRVSQKKPVVRMRTPLWLGLRVLSTGVAAILAMCSVVLCVAAVSQQRGLGPQESMVVAIGGIALFFCALFLIADLLLAALDGWLETGGYEGPVAKRRRLRAEAKALVG
jgi:hypothetical protein